MAKQVKEMTAVRLDPADRRKLKVLAKRLKVNDADLLRYAVKLVLEDFAPLSDHAKEGAELLSAFLDHPLEKLRWLDLDANRIDQIMHADLQNPKLRVDKDELGMLISGYATPAYREWCAAVASGKQSLPFETTGARTFLFQKYVEPLRYGEEFEKEELQAKRRQK
jgi:Ribbon-helix-helix domain